MRVLPLYRSAYADSAQQCIRDCFSRSCRMHHNYNHVLQVYTGHLRSSVWSSKGLQKGTWPAPSKQRLRELQPPLVSVRTTSLSLIRSTCAKFNKLGKIPKSVRTTRLCLICSTCAEFNELEKVPKSSPVISYYMRGHRKAATLNAVQHPPGEICATGSGSPTLDGICQTEQHMPDKNFTGSQGFNLCSACLAGL